MTARQAQQAPFLRRHRAIGCLSNPPYFQKRLERLTQNQRNWGFGYIERYNRTVRYDWLSQYLFESIAEVQLHATQWLWTYNNEGPNTAIGGIPPRQKLALVA